MKDNSLLSDINQMGDEMTNRDLWNFNFVDRIYARKQCGDFLNSPNASNIFLINGNKNVGKSYLIDKIIQENQSKTFIDIDLSRPACQCAYLELIQKLDYQANGKFFKYIKDNYVKFFKIVNGIMSPIVKISSGIDPSNIFNLLLDINSIAEDSSGHQESSVQIIYKYINEISKSENLIIVMRNFTECDAISINFIFQIIIMTIENNLKLKYIISTDSQKLKEKKEVYKFLFSDIDVIRTDLDRFQHPDQFYEMLFDIFNFTSEDKDSIEHVFNFCQGYPGALKDIVAKMYLENPSIISEDLNYAIWDKDTLRSIITGSTTLINFNNFIEKLIFLTTLFVDIEWEFDNLLKAVEFVCSKIHINIINIGQINLELCNLIHEKQVLELYLNNGYQFIKLNDSINKNIYYDSYRNDNFAPLLSRYLFEYLIQNKNNFFDIDKIKNQEAWLSYKAKYDNWEKINLSIGKHFYQKNYISLAQQIFYRIEPIWKLLQEEDRIIISSCFYNIGKYDLAKQLVFDDNFPHSFEYSMLYVLIENISMNKITAIEYLDKMLRQDSLKSKVWEILNMKQRILANIETERKNAKKIYDYLLKNISSMNSNLYDSVLMGCMEYYRGEIVQNNYLILEKKYRTNNNTVMLGELLVNKGFDLFWQGKIDLAERTFKESLKIFETVQIHELSYVLNNYINCLMFKGEFEEAISNIRRALLFNKSKYAEIVLTNHLMVCYAVISNNQYVHLFQDLERIIRNGQHKGLDISIILKVTYSLGFVQEYCYNENQEILFRYDKSYTSKALEIANNYDDTSLPYIWFKDWNRQVEIDIKNRVDEKYVDFFNLRFEPWLLTITHY